MANTFYGCPLGPDSGAAAAPPRDIAAALEILRPRPAPRPLVRIGPGSDGAYLLPDDFEGVTACFSPGVNDRKGFEDHLTDRYGIAAHMCDRSSSAETLRTPLRDGLQTFERLWLDTTGGEDAVSLPDWVARHAPDPAGDLILQMDIEGAEYRNLLATPRAVLRRFRIIALELHGLRRLDDVAVLRDVVGPVLAKIGRDFLCVHAHPNNAGGLKRLAGVNASVPGLLEATFLRRDRFTDDAAGDVPVSLPHRLDIPANMPGRPPVFLDDSWRGRPPEPEETVRMLSAEVAYLRRRVAVADAARADAERLHRQVALLQEAAGQAPPARPSRGDDAEAVGEVARGRPFVLSSAAGPRRRGAVAARAPFFFHTAEETDPRITIDLGAPRALDRIEIVNRTNRDLDRARGLFLRLGLAAEDESGPVVPVHTPPGFFETPPEPSRTPLGGVPARYVTILAAGRTILHLSDVRIFARPQRPGA